MGMQDITFHEAEIQKTSDGSSTLVHMVLGELYHSRHGAWTESQHIYILHGLHCLLETELPSIRVFEMGFGSGLNAALTREEADRHQIPVHYTSLELYPLDASVIDKMEMPRQTPDARKRWLDLHRSTWGEATQISPYFTLHKLQAAFPNIPQETYAKWHLVYYDAFAPAAQPELWNAEAMRACYEILVPGGMWLSYCAKGQVRRILRDAGFEVEALPGPPGKREITRAIKPSF